MYPNLWYVSLICPTDYNTTFVRQKRRDFEEKCKDFIHTPRDFLQKR